MTTVKEPSHTHYISLGSCNTPVAAPVANPCMKQDATTPNIGNKKMYNDMESYETTETERQKAHLECRLSSAECDHRQKFVVDFHLYDDPSPVDGEDLVKRVMEGKYELKEVERYGMKSKEIRWRDPAKPIDRAGFDAANDKLQALAKTTRDEIVIFPPEKGLESLRNFQSATFH